MQTGLIRQYTVNFSSYRTEGDSGKAEVAQRIIEFASRQQGFLHGESARGSDGFGITASYRTSLDAIEQWNAYAEYLKAQRTEGGLVLTYELRLATV